MAFCKNCGNKLEDGAKFCSKCGNPSNVKNEVQQPVENSSVQEQPKKRGCWKKIGIGILILWILGLIGKQCGGDNNTTSTDAETPQATEQVAIENQDKVKEERATEEKAKEEETPKEEANPLAKFAGTYRFDYHGDETSVFIVSEDGRCVKKSQGHATFLGNVVSLSQHAFKLQTNSEPWTFMMDVKFYNQGEYCGYTALSDWRINDIVFDLSEGRLYRKKSEYDNRDIARAEYTKMTHDSSTESKNSICKTCGKEYTPDNEPIVSSDYCYRDYPQTCGTCGKTYTINSDGNEACKGTCASCYSKHSAVNIYESVTGRKVQ